MKAPTTLSLSQPSLSNSRSVSPTASAKSVKQRAPTMPTVFSRNNSSVETSSNKGSSSNIQRMYTSLYEEASNETESLNESQLINSSVGGNSSSRRPHSVGPIPHAVTIDGISSDQPVTPFRSSNESEPVASNNNLTKKIETNDRSRKIDFHLAYFLLYTQPYDYNRVTFALNIIESLIDLIPRQLINFLLTTNNIQPSPINVHNTRLHELCFRHRRAIEGKNFYSNFEMTHSHHNQSYLYILVNLLLINARSYFPKSFEHRLTPQDMQGNRKVHLRSLSLLKRICHDLSNICMENFPTPNLLINYIYDLFQKLSFQKTILHLFNTLIEKINPKIRQIKGKSLSKTIYDYNIEPLYDELSRQYLRELVQLLEEIILLEHVLHYHQQRNDSTSQQVTMNGFTSNIFSSIIFNNSQIKLNDYSNIGSFHFRHHTDLDFINLISKANQSNPSTNSMRYVDNHPIVNQILFLSSILQYLKQIDFIENHRHIISLVIRTLPHCGASLKSISSLVIEQICRNLCFVVQAHNQQQQANKMKFR